jgi:putative ABC transport system permease protein
MPKNNKMKYSTIPFSVLLFMAWRNLTTKKFRSTLTVTGIAIGIGSIFFLLSFGLGLRSFVTDELIGNKSIKTIDITSQNSKIVKLNDTNLEKIAGLPKVDKVGTSYSMAGKMTYNKSEINIIAYGADSVYQDFSNFSLVTGKLLTKDTMDSVLISKSSMEELGIEEASQAIGQTIAISLPLDKINEDDPGSIDKEFAIVGVIDSSYGSEIFVSNNVFDQYDIDQYAQIKISADSVDDIPNLRKQIESMGLTTSSPIDTIDQVNQIFSYFNAILIGFGLIGMVIAVLGMLNTLTVSLIERIGEIGLLISLGGRHKDMKKLFIYEAILLSVIGSVAGLVLATLLEFVLNIFVNKMVVGRGFTEAIYLFNTPIWLYGALVALMVIVGLLVSLMPARRASKINPIDSMRQG